MVTVKELYQIYKQHPKVITDSRKIEEGCIFFALKGPSFNGNEFASEALKKGASYAVVDEGVHAKEKKCLLVNDCLKALQDLAKHHRQHFTIPLLAITGSNGKTTTKELLNEVFSTHFKTHCTKGNFNNHIGVPLTLLQMPDDTELAIIEMGANHQKEIDFLCRIALPTHGLITNIGKAHLEGFKGIEGVKKGKSELYKYLEFTGGMIFVNTDEQHLKTLAKNNTLQLQYGQSDSIEDKKNACLVGLKSSHPHVKSTFWDNDNNKLVEVNSHLMGRHNFNNIMAAIVVGRYFKIPPANIKSAIEHYKSTNNRSQWTKLGSNTFLMDAYNANPDSMKQALLYFSKMAANHKIAILGDMLELGDYSEEEHNKIVQIALENEMDQIWLVGPAFTKTRFQSSAIKKFENIDELKKWYLDHQVSDTHFLLKGSRGIKLEKFVTTT